MSGPGLKFEKYRAAVHAKGFRIVSPFRLGVAVGESGDNVRNPYTTERGRRCFDAGVAFGAEKRQRQEKEGGNG